MSSSVYQSFRWINIISRIFGVMPLKMMPGDLTTGPVCSVSSLDYMYSVALLIASVVHGVLAPFYVLHTIMPYEYEQSIFTVAAPAHAQPQQQNTVNEIGSQVDEDEVSEMATAMKILNPIMISVSSICSRLVALAFLHRRFGEFITVLHNTDRLMEVPIRSQVSTVGGTLLQTLDKYLL